MPTLPPIPAWESLHVLVVHIPIGLLLIAPLLVICGMFPGRWRAGLRLAALILLIVGTGMAYLAVETGEAAAEVADRTPEINAVLEQHQDSADDTLVTFIIATVFYAAVVGLTTWVKWFQRPGIAITMQVVALAVLLYGALMIAQTGHLGGRLVHEFGLRAMI